MRAHYALALLLATRVWAATWVVAAGVQKYQDSAIARLQYADDDVTAMCSAFRGAGVPADHIVLLVSSATDPLLLPTREHILQSLEAFRPRAAVGDTFVFIFSGHGMGRDGQTYLLTYDCRWAQVNTDALAMQRVHEALRGLQASNVLFIIDACRNDPEAGKSQQDATMSEGMAKGVRPLCYAPPGQTVNTALLMACGIGQRAWEMPESKHGTFTFFLLHGLKARYLRDGGALRLSALAAYVSSKVPEWCSRNMRRTQNPLLDQPQGGDFTIVPAGFAGFDLTQVDVDTSPRGAKVFVKGPSDTTGRDVGPSPCKVDVMEPGAECRITVVMPGYAKQEHPFHLERGQSCAWNVVLQREPAPADDPGRGTIEINSDPPWAAVKADGRNLGPTPLFLTLPAGQRNLTVSQFNYEDCQLNLVVAPGTTVPVPTVRLRPRPGHAAITSEPAGAEVIVDGKAIGAVTPFDLPLPHGLYEITCRLPNYTDATAKVAVRANTTVKAALELKPLPAGLTLESEPPGAAVFVDGQDTGKQTPVELPGLAPGRHTVELRHEPDCDPLTVALELNPNQAFKPGLMRLQRREGTLKLNSDPPGAVIFVDGKPTGKQCPTTLVLSAGRHSVEVRQEGFASTAQDLTVQKGATLEPDTFILSALKGQVKVTTNPAGATVRVNGEGRGHTPCTLELPVGEVTLELTIDDHKPEQRKVTVQDTQPVNLDVELTRETGRVVLTSKPVGATVFFEGKDTGKVTPCELDLPVGTVSLTLKLKDFRDLDTAVTVTKDQPAQPGELVLPAGARGEVIFQTDPPGADVLWNNLNLGFTPNPVKLPLGEQTVVLRHEGYESETVVARVIAGQTVKRDPVKLRPQLGQIFIQSEPAGASIFVNGKDTGKVTPDQVPVSVGEATVTVNLAGYGEVERKVVVPNSETVSPPAFALTKLVAPDGWPAYIPFPPVPTKGLQFRVRPADGMPQVLVPAGEFLMGSPADEGEPDEHPQKWVKVSAFWMDLHEVTMEQYWRYTQATGKPMPPVPRWGRDSDRCPVVMVTWEEARDYARWVSERGSLPAEAQWEYAARAGKDDPGTVFGAEQKPVGNFADESSKLPAKMPGFDDGWRYTAPVCTFRPDAFGLFDMIGNVREMTADAYDGGWYRRLGDHVTDPANTRVDKGITLRGLSWFDPSPIRLHPAERMPYNVRERKDWAGFRCVEPAH